MSPKERSAMLLRTIERLVGIEVGGLSQASEDAAAAGAGSTTDDHLQSVQMLQVVELFRALPSEERRSQALRMLEVFAAHAHRNGPLLPRLMR